MTHPLGGRVRPLTRPPTAIEDRKRLLYSPDPTFTGSVTLGYTVADEHGAMTQGSATVEVVAAEVAGPVSSAPVAPAPASPAVAAARAAALSELPRTGADAGMAVLVALLLVTGGAAMTRAARRRRA